MCQWIGWRENVKRKAPYSMGKSMMSRLRFSRLNQSIENGKSTHWEIIWEYVLFLWDSLSKSKIRKALNQ
jgi:hypothetical protein